MMQLDGVISSVSVSDAIDQFIRIGNVSGRWTRKSADIYEKHLGYFKEWTPKTFDEINKDIIYKYLDEVSKGRRRDKDGKRISAPYQKQQAFRVLRTFFMWCEDEEQGYIDKSPMRKMKIGLPVDRVHIPPTNDEIKMILDCFDDSFLGKRNRAIFYTFCNTGARLCEILADFANNKPGMKPEDIFWKEKEIRILGKGNVERIVSIEPVTIKSLLAYDMIAQKRFPGKQAAAFFLTEEGKPLQGDGFGESLRRLLRRIEKNTGKKIDVTSHDLRRRVVTLAREAGLNTLEIMDITGHKTPKMVQLYSKTHESKEARRKLSLHSPVAGL